jgi:hypothetical protein
MYCVQFIYSCALDAILVSVVDGRPYSAPVDTGDDVFLSNAVRSKVTPFRPQSEEPVMGRISHKAYKQLFYVMLLFLMKNRQMTF